MSWSYSVTTDALDVLCAQLMRNLFATAKFLVSLQYANTHNMHK